MEQANLEQRTYECPSRDHLGNNKWLFPLMNLNGHPSGFYFCEPCTAMYSIENDKPKYANTDLLETLPIQIYRDKKNVIKKIDPIDLVRGKQIYISYIDTSYSSS